MRAALRLAGLPLLLTLALAVLLVTLPGRTGLALHVYSVALAAIVLARLLALLRRGLPAGGESPLDAALRPSRHAPERLPELARLEREVTLGLSTAFDLHYRLRPTLRRIAGELLAARRGIDLDAQPEAARRVLGEDAWELVRGDREPPRDRFARGSELGSLRAVVASLESL